MVEGPGATRNGRKLQIAVGKTLVTGAESTGVESDASSLSQRTQPDRVADELAGRTLEEAFTVGKELFLVFATTPWDSTISPVGLRLHFGMNGSLVARRVNSSDLAKKSSGAPPWRQNKVVD